MWGPFLILLTFIIILVSFSEKDGLSENSEEELEMLARARGGSTHKAVLIDARALILNMINS